MELKFKFRTGDTITFDIAYSGEYAERLLTSEEIVDIVIFVERTGTIERHILPC